MIEPRKTDHRAIPFRLNTLPRHWHLQIFAMALCLFAIQARADIITLRADAWCPYNCDPGSDKPGLIIDIARAIFGPAGHTIDYQLMPWSRALDEVRKGKVIGAVGALPSEAPDLIYGTNPVTLDEPGFAFKKGMIFKYTGATALDPYRIATIKDYNYDDGEIDAYLKAHEQETNRIQANTGDHAGVANLKKLLAGRVELALDSHAVLTHLVRQEGVENKVALATSGHFTGVHIGFSPVHPRAKEWAELLSSGVDALRKRGEMAAIFARYGLTERQKP
ncbi:MAG: transporter substrate-binding domain-containing protein [Magnetococcales bacterium]|nr:transporter substrate-binding domain-containing protein [Magnetococcales bacterium]